MTAFRSQTCSLFVRSLAIYSWSYLKQENVKTKKKTFQWLKIILNPSSLQVTTKGENFKKFLPPNYSLCWEWERKMVNTFVDIVKWKLDGGLTMLNFIFSWRKAISLLTRCPRSYHFVFTTRPLLKKSLVAGSASFTATYPASRVASNHSIWISRDFSNRVRRHVSNPRSGLI